MVNKKQNKIVEEMGANPLTYLIWGCGFLVGIGFSLMVF